MQSIVSGQPGRCALYLFTKTVSCPNILSLELAANHSLATLPTISNGKLGRGS